MKAGELDTRRGELRESFNSWEIALASLAEDTLGGTLAEEVDELLAAHESVLVRLDEQYTAVLDLRAEISAQGQRLTELVQRLGESGRLGLWVLAQPESAPIWSVPGLVEESGGFWPAVHDAWREAVSPLGGFLRDEIPNLVAQFLLFVGLLTAILFARRRTSEGDGPALLPETSVIFDRPVSTALIATIVLSRLFHPLAPEIFNVLIRVGTIPALLRLVPRIVPARYVGISIAIALLYVVDMGEFLFRGTPALYRGHLLAVQLLAFGGALAFLRRESGSEDGRGRQLRRFCGAVVVFFMAVSCIANVYGAAELARLITDGVLQTLYIVIMVIVATRMVEDGTAIALSNAPLQHLRSVRLHRPMLQRRATLVIRSLVILLGARAVFGLLGLDQAFIDGFFGIMDVGGTVGSLTITVGDIVAFVLTLWISIQISRLLQFMLGEDILPGVSLPRGIPHLITRLTHYAVVTLGFMLAIAASGADLGRLAILAGGLGVGLGFGMQSIVNNFISGLILMVERPIQVGDTVEIGTLIGRVRTIGLRASTVRTYSGAEVVVPNANLVANEVVNWTLTDRRRRVELPLSVAYGTDPDEVCSLLLAAAADHADALEHPEPLAVFLGFGDSALLFELRFWTREFEEWQRVRGEVATQVQRSLSKAGIEIPFPQRTIHLKSEPPGEPESREL